MRLRAEEREMLEGAQGAALRKSMEILCALGRIYGAERLIPVETVQISGVSYDNLGEAGLEFVRSLAADARVRVPTTLNPAGMDMRDWRKLGIPESFAEKQTEVVALFASMGVETTCSCTPYLIGNVPERGAHLAWGESSAVTFANSVLGARTNKEGGPSSIAAALTGRTPAYGLHLDAPRAPGVLVQVESEPRRATEFGALGKLIGESIGDAVPLIEGVTTERWDLLKALSAALPTYGGAPIFHLAERAEQRFARPGRRLAIAPAALEAAARSLDDADARSIDFVFLGCPHLSLEELRRIAELLEGTSVTKELWLGVARGVKEEADAAGISAILSAAGARIACDTCHVVAPLAGRFESFATNSAKGVYYGRAKNRFKSVFRSLEECIRLATEE